MAAPLIANQDRASPWAGRRGDGAPDGSLLMHWSLNTMVNRSLLLLPAIALYSFGCSSESTSSNAPTARHPLASTATCVDYPDGGYRVFPVDVNAAGGSWGVCPLSCHTVMAAAGLGQRALDQALPNGPCDDEGATCGALMAGWSPPCKNAGGPGNEYTCTCQGGSWHCAITSQGAAIGEPQYCLGEQTPSEGGMCTVTWTSTEVCSCGSCKKLCSSDGDCATGKCNVDTLCFPVSATCSGPFECPTTCSGFCDS